MPSGLYYDAAVYEQSAMAIRDLGLFREWPGADLRTYGYPLALAIASEWGGRVGLGTRDSAFALQWPVLLASAWFLAASLTRNNRPGDPRRRKLLFLAVAANPLVVARCAEVLTEALSISCLLVAAGAILRLPTRSASSMTSASPTAMLAVAGIAAGFALMLRPASIILPLAFVVAVTVWLRRGRKRLGLPVAGMLRMGVIALGAVLAPLIPQVILNLKVFGRFTPFPVVDIADIQAQAGVAMFRYATNVSGCGDPRMAFINPWMPRVRDDFSTLDGLRYYAFDFPAGPVTALLHVFSGLDPRPFLTYVTQVGTTYERVLQLLMIGIVVLAAPAAWSAAAHWRILLGYPGFAFLALTGLGAVGVLAYSAAEYRFGAIPVTLICLLAAWSAASRPRPSHREFGIVLAAFLLLTPAWLLLSEAVLAQSSAWRACT